MHLGAIRQGRPVIGSLGRRHRLEPVNVDLIGTCYQVAKAEDPGGAGISTAGQTYPYIIRVIDSGWGSPRQNKWFLTLAARWNHPRDSAIIGLGMETSKGSQVSLVCSRGEARWAGPSWGLTVYQLQG